MELSRLDSQVALIENGSRKARNRVNSHVEHRKTRTRALADEMRPNTVLEER